MGHSISDERRDRLTAEMRAKRTQRDKLNKRIAKIKAFLKEHPTTRPLKAGDLIVDVSSHQATVDWQAMKGAGVKGSYNKMTEGRDFVDEFGVRNLRGSLAVGLYTGAYHFARPDTGGGTDNDAVAECDDFIAACRRAFPAGVGFIPPREWAQGKKGVLGVLDFETRPYSARWALAWANHFRQKTGVRAAVYGYGEPLNAIQQVIVGGAFGFTIVAAYVDPPWQRFVNDAIEPHARMWQYTSSGSLAGESPLDLNRWLG
jgi:lysozyme